MKERKQNIENKLIIEKDKERERERERERETEVCVKIWRRREMGIKREREILSMW